MIGPGHNHDLAIALTQHSSLAIAAADGEQHAPPNGTSSTISSTRASVPERTMDRSPGKSQAVAQPSVRTVLLSLLSASPAAMAACIPLQGSTTCPAFQSASISTDPVVVGFYPFLKFVSSTSTFDEQMRSYLQTSYVQERYQTLLQCGGISLTNTTDLYARFTATVICNGIIQNSIGNCSLSAAASRPVCAETCAQFAESEAYVTADSDLCSAPVSDKQSEDRLKQIRADFVNCALPDDSLSSQNCITGIANEPLNCGYGNSTIGLCSYCSSGGINSTDTCCYNSDVKTRCAGVVLPSITPTLSLPTSTATVTATPTAAPKDPNRLSGGAIAGIVIGSVVGVALIAALLFFCLVFRRRRQGSQHGSIFNQPSPSRQGPVMGQVAPPLTTSQPGYDVVPGGRIARMSALEGPTAADIPRRGSRDAGAAAAVGAAAGYAAARRRGDDHSSSDGYNDSPVSDRGATGVLRPPPTTLRRNGSLSSGSVLAGGEDAQSPTSGGMSSPQGMASQQSEQLPFFKDYYSQDDIHPGDRVAVLWAYQPRAGDEFSLERGDMLKVVGIWDDGWATGVLVDERAEDWEASRQAQRDSGVSNTSGRRDTSPPVSGEIKAFPLVCVCLPEHWRKTIEGDGSTETGSSAHQHTTGS